MKRFFLLLSLFNLHYFFSLAQAHQKNLRDILDNKKFSVEQYTDSLDRIVIWAEHNKDSSIAILKGAINAATNTKDTLHLVWNIYYYASELTVQRKLREAAEQYKLAEELFTRIGDKRGVNRCEYGKAEIFLQNGDLTNGAPLMQNVLHESLKLRDATSQVRSMDRLGYIAGLQRDLERAREFYQRGAETARAIGWCSEEVNILRSYGSALKGDGKTEQAVVMMMRADSILKICAPQNRQLKAVIQVELAIIDLEQGHTEAGIKKLLSAQVLFDTLINYVWSSFIRGIIAGALRDMGRTKEAMQAALEGYDIAQKHLLLKESQDNLLELHRISAAQGNFKSAYEFYQKMVQIKDSLVNRKSIEAMVSKELEFEHEKKILADSLEFARKEAVKDLEIKTKEANIARQRIALFSAAGGLLLIIALAFSIYKGKKRSDELLLNILPAEVAEELKAKGKTTAKDFKEVTVLFTDFKNFTSMSEKLSAQELVNEINYCYSAFDNIITRHGIEKIKTIGDSYMCAGGLPVANTTNAEDTVRAAIEIRDFMEEEKQKRIAAGLPYFEIRIGCNTGPVVAGIVGIKKFAYDIWGDTVNIASRMESSGEPGKVNISGSTYELVKTKFKCEHRGKITAKNKGEIDMYFVEQIRLNERSD